MGLSWLELTDPAGGSVRVQVDYVTVDTYRTWSAPDYEYGPSVDHTSGAPSFATQQVREFSAQSAQHGVTVAWNDDKGLSSLTAVHIWQQAADGSWQLKWEGSAAEASGQQSWLNSEVKKADVRYNAFGEVVAKGLNGVEQEYFAYDNAGHLWKTNAGDGVAKVTLYDLQGHATASIGSDGITSLRDLSADQAAAMTQLRRTDKVYDLVGNVVQELLPQRSTHQGGVTLVPQGVQYHLNSESTGGTEYGGVFAWTGSNSLSFSWPSLAGLGNGDVRVVVQYRSESMPATMDDGYGGQIARPTHDQYGGPLFTEEVRTLTREFSAGHAQGGVTIDWTETGDRHGGVGQILHFQLYKKDAVGNWQSLYDRTAFGMDGQVVEIATPTDASSSVSFQLRAVGSSAWTTPAVVNFGEAYRFDLRGMAQGDLNGNRTSDTTWGKVVSYHPSELLGQNEYGEDIYSGASYSGSDGLVQTRYDYDAMGRLAVASDVNTGSVLDRRYYDAGSRVIRSGNDGSISLDFLKARDGGDGRSGDGAQRINTYYDGAGRTSFQEVWNRDGTLAYDTRYNAYDGVGNVLSYSVVTNRGTSSETTNIYDTRLERQDGYKQVGNHLTSWTAERKDGDAQIQLDAQGNTIGVTDTMQPSYNRSIVNDASGTALYVNQGGHVQRQLIVNGKVLARYGQETTGANDDGSAKYGEVSDFNFSYQSINVTTATSGTNYTVKAGDTLQGIAEAIYGDGQLWYVIAQANGLNSPSELRVGQVLNVPAKVGTIHNTAQTYKTYDPSKIQGDTSARLAVPAADGGGGCGVIGTIIIVIVAVVVSIFTAGAGALLMAGTLGGASFGTIMTAGAVAMAGGAGAGISLAAVGASMIGGAVGSIASQGVAMAMGMQDKFSWSSVATSAIAAGVTAGVGGAMGGASALQGLKGIELASAVAQRAIVSATVSQGVNMALGLQKSFSWTAVAAAGAGAFVGSQVGGYMPEAAQGDTMQRLINGVVSGVAAGVTSAVLRGGRVVVEQIAADAFANALANEVVDGMKSSGQQEQKKNDANQNVEPVERPPVVTASNSTVAPVGEIEPEGPSAGESEAEILARRNSAWRARSEEDFISDGYVPRVRGTIRTVREGETLSRMGNGVTGAGAIAALNGKADFKAGDAVWIPDEQVYADGLITRDQARDVGLAIYARDNARAAALAQSIMSSGEPLRDLSPTVENARRLGLRTGWEVKPYDGPQHFVGPWDGSVRKGAAESYIESSRGGLDAVRGDSWHYAAGVKAGQEAILATGEGVIASRVLGAVGTVGRYTNRVITNSIDDALSWSFKVSPEVGTTDFALDARTISNIQSIDKGLRPSPISYMPASAIDAQLAEFESGASRLMSKTNFEKYGPAQSDGTSFVSPRGQIDQLLQATKGNPRALEDALGLPSNFLESDILVRIDISAPRELGLRIPSGNEAGANPFWIPGGKLPNGNLEAIVDLGAAPASKYSWRQLKF